MTIVVALFPAPGIAQDTRAVIGGASKAMGAGTLKTVVYFVNAATPWVQQLEIWIIAVHFPADRRLVPKAELLRAAGRGN